MSDIGTQSPAHASSWSQVPCPTQIGWCHKLHPRTSHPIDLTHLHDQHLPLLLPHPQNAMAHLLHEIENYNESGRTTPINGIGFKLKEPIQPNIHEVVLGDWWVRPSSPASSYPEEIVGRNCDRLYVCQWCFKYVADGVPDRYLRHMVCSIHPPSEFKQMREDVVWTARLTSPCCTGNMSLPRHPLHLRFPNLHTTRPHRHNPRPRRSLPHTLRAKPLPLRKTLPRFKIRLLRRNNLPLLHSRPPPATVETKNHRILQ